tara:strand:+ start:29503 stop:30033 length:531 start_codon:yes stop_codon:yes gene_type:complete
MEWIFDNKDPLIETFLSSLMLFTAVIVLTRIIGLRSFAKFTAYDFAFTIAIGSILSTTLTSKTSVIHGTVAIASLLLLAYIFSILQRKFSWINSAISNAPLLLMKNNQIIEKNLKHARIEKSQLMAKLREANVIQLNDVLAVVLESTGDISVLHKSSNISFEDTDSEILEGVRTKP